MRAPRQLGGAGARVPGNGKGPQRTLEPVILSRTLRHLQGVAVLPDQFTPPAPLHGEERLILAVLEDAVNCFQHHAFACEPRLRRLHKDARDWIYSNNRTWPFSFENICHTLGIAPAYLREGLAHWLAASVLRAGGARLPSTGSASQPRHAHSRSRGRLSSVCLRDRVGGTG